MPVWDPYTAYVLLEFLGHHLNDLIVLCSVKNLQFLKIELVNVQKVRNLCCIQAVLIGQSGKLQIAYCIQILLKIIKYGSLNSRD